MTRRLNPFLLAALVAGTLNAAAPGVYALCGGRVHTLEGPVLERGCVLIRDGRIEAVGIGLTVPADAEVIDASGLDVVPGFIDGLSDLGLREMDAVHASVDAVDLGDFNPQLRAATAVHPESELIPVARAAGITASLSAPGLGGGPVLPGQAALLHLQGRTLEAMAISSSVAMVLNWPMPRTRTFDFATFKVVNKPWAEVKKDQDQKLRELADLLEAARHYALDPAARDLKLEALVPVVQGRTPVLVYADKVREINQALAFCEQQKLRMILAGGAEAWKVKGILKERGIPVILARTLNLPPSADDPYDRAMTLPAELVAAGVAVAIGSGQPSMARQLPQHAGVAAAYGLSHEEALKAITLAPATILGFGDQLGSLKPGKVADLVLTDGDPLELRSRVVRVFIQGRPAPLENRQQKLYETFK